MKIDYSSKNIFGLLFKLTGFYKIYQRWLESQITKDPLPNHIAIILDGNRRWAKYRLIRINKGHLVGAEKAEDLLNWIYEMDIKITTVYVLSNENLEREDSELINIYNLLHGKLCKLRDDSRIHEKQMRIKAIGNVDLLPLNLQRILKVLEEETISYKSMFLNIAVAYGGQKELVDAIKKISSMVISGKLKIEDINEKTIESFLYTSHLPQPCPDLILRTSGEKRLSGFLIWQGAYSELIFMDIFWPEFKKIDLMKAIRTYQNRIRRFGK
jgi:tritrans,polycis-undecaprenyl-diphosphate synthase [geranylgeranyl-diphosphate specific]